MVVEGVAPRVLVASTAWWPSAARIAVAFAELGWCVDAICVVGDPLTQTRVVRRFHRYRALRPLAALTAAIRASAPDLVVPCDDRAVIDLQTLYATVDDGAIAGVIARSIGSLAQGNVIGSRVAFIDMARGEGVRAPATFALETAKELPAVLNRVGFPAVLKLDGTWGGLGVAKIHDEREATRLFAHMTRRPSAARTLKRLLVNGDPFSLRPALARTRPRASVQVYVAGRPATCAFSCWEGEVQSLIGVEVLCTRQTFGPSAVVRLVRHPEMEAAARRIARRLRLSGLHGLDFQIEDSTGALHLLEMNPRVTPLAHLALPGERDVVASLARCVDGRSAARPPVTRADVIALFPQALGLSPSAWAGTEFHVDIPWSEPALVRDLAQPPWPDRSWMARFASLAVWRAQPNPPQAASADVGRAASADLPAVTMAPGTLLAMPETG